VPKDLSAAGNPLPSDHVPDGKSPAEQAIYQRYLSLAADNVRQEALSNWVEDCRELRAAGDVGVGVSLFYAEAEKAMHLNPIYGGHVILENWQLLSQDGTYDMLLSTLAMASDALSKASGTLNKASQAAYYAGFTAADHLDDLEAAFLWAHRAIKLSKLSGDTYTWIGDCWVLVGRTGASNGMGAGAEGAFKAGLKFQAQLAGEVPATNFNLALGWKHYADYLDGVSRQGEALLALGEAAKVAAAIPGALRGHPEIVAVVAAYHSRREPG
jgi:hypothetical protein